MRFHLNSVFNVVFMSCLSIILMVSTAHATQVAHAEHRFDDYWTVQEFNHHHPEQKAISDAFVLRVRNDPISEKKINKPIKISIIYPGNQASDYWRRSVKSMEERLKQIAPNYELTSFFTKPDSEIAEQAQQIGAMLEKGVDYIVFTLNAKRHRSLISKVLARNKEKLILQNITTPLRYFGKMQPFQYVGFDHAIGTDLLAAEYLKRTEGRGDYAILYGPRGYVNDMRGGTFFREMKKHPELKLKASYYVGFNREKAYLATLDILENHSQIKFIFSSSTDIALGVIDALKEKNMLGKIMTNGWGGGASELEAIRKGELDFTVMRMNDDNGVAMAEAIYLDQSNRRNEVPVIFSGDILIVRKGMEDAEIKELEKRAFRYSQ